MMIDGSRTADNHDLLRQIQKNLREIERGGRIPRNGFTTVTVPDHMLEQILAVMSKYECDSLAEAVSVAASFALVAWRM